MSDAQHALSAGSEGGELCAGTFKGGGKCCSWAGRRARISGLGLGVGAVSASMIDTHLCLVTLNV